MVETNRDLDPVATARTDLLALMDALAGEAQSLGLPGPPQGFLDARSRLARDESTVLVAGEAKRGKSSFINALIGRTILPVDVQVATSQVFRVQHAQTGSFRLRFEDDSTQEITAADLDRFGSQVQADRGQRPTLDRLVRWIEVDTPTLFIPANVTLLDTPGLGSMYAAHAQVTQRFLPHADAVIFALDSGQPITDLELGFVETILTSTPHILFIQTKIDQHRRRHWEEIQERNQEILRQRFGDRLADHRVWPIGNRLLLQGAETGDEDFIVLSRQRALNAALQEFLFRVHGYNRLATAIAATTHVHATNLGMLTARREALETRSEPETVRLQEQARARQRAFASEWGEGGHRRQEVQHGVRLAGRSGRDAFVTAIQPGGEIATTQEGRIDALDRIEDLRRLGEVIAGDATTAAVDAWKDTCEQARLRCVGLLTPFAREAEAMSWILSAEGPDARSIRSLRGLRRDWIDDLPKPGLDDSPIVPLATGAIEVLMMMGAVAPPVGIAAAAVALAWTAARHFIVSERAVVQAARKELRAHLDETFDQLDRAFFVDTVPAFGGRTLVDGYFAAMESGIMNRLDQVAAQRLAAAEAEIQRLEEDARLDREQRAEEAASIDRQLAGWTTLGASLESIAARLPDLARQVQAASGVSS